MSFFKNGKLRFFKVEAAIILTGIVLLLIGGMIEDSSKKDVALTESPESYQQQYVLSENDKYAAKYEKQVERILKGIDGVKGVTAAVYVKSEGECIPAYNSSSDKSVIKEKNDKDEAEERRDVYENSIVIIKDSQGNEEALILSETAPEIEGIAVCIEGEKSKNTEEKIINTLMALYGIPITKISITW